MTTLYSYTSVCCTSAEYPRALVKDYGNVFVGREINDRDDTVDDISVFVVDEKKKKKKAYRMAIASTYYRRTCICVFEESVVAV